jgi:hypothetical protein
MDEFDRGYSSREAATRRRRVSLKLPMIVMATCVGALGLLVTGAGAQSNDPDDRVPGFNASAVEEKRFGGTLDFRIRCAAPCSVSGGGRVVTTNRKKKRVSRIRTEFADLNANGRGVLSLRLSQKAQRRIRRAVARDRRANAQVVLRASRDNAAREAEERFRIRFR